MLSLLVFLSLVLPMTILATSDKVLEHSDQRPGSQPGDTLGITRCYCASKNFPNEDYFGYYYLWDYYNIHTDQRFHLESTCYKNKWTTYGVMPMLQFQLECFRPKNGERECMKDGLGNKFCYYMYGKERLDYFTYNHQKRGIPLDSPVAVHASEAEWMKTCDALCHEKVGHGDMELLKGHTLVYANNMTPGQDHFNTIDNEWSHITYYPEVDDMCHGCK